MARKAFGGSQTESVSGYFRKIFAEHPEWLRRRSNEAALKRWLEDHPGFTSVPGKVKTNLTNIKSVLKRKKKRRGKRAQVESLQDGTKPAVRISTRDLEALENQIDEGLTLAKTLDRTALGEVIALLRKARNEIVLKLHR
jgi:hypothetical protein